MNNNKCFKCGKEKENLKRCNDRSYICEECLSSLEDYSICSDCGEILLKEEEVYTLENGNIVCEICYGEYAVCDNCEDEYHTDNMHYIDSEEVYVCEECYNENYSICSDCDNAYRTINMYYVNSISDYVCEECFNESYGSCDNCGEFFNVEGLTNGLCGECYEESNSRIYSYHNYPAFEERKLEGEEPRFLLGIENEIECQEYSHKEDSAKIVYDNLDAYCAEDGSLDHGLEIITQPMSFGYIREHENDFRKCFSRLIENGCRSHDTNTCGLHVHVTRPSEEVVDKIILIMETYREELIKFSRRSQNALERWASFYSNECSNFINSLEFIKKLKDNTSKRYMALNNTNSKTIEFRIFRGTLNFETFMSTIELVNNMVNLCIDNDNVEAITWDKLTKGVYISQYVKDREIFTDKKPMNDLTYTRYLTYVDNKSKQVAKYFNNYVIELINGIASLKLPKSTDKINTFTLISADIFSYLNAIVRNTSGFEINVKSEFDKQSILVSYKENISYYLGKIECRINELLRNSSINISKKSTNNAQKYIKNFDFNFKESEVL